MALDRSKVHFLTQSEMINITVFCQHYEKKKKKKDEVLDTCKVHFFTLAKTIDITAFCKHYECKMGKVSTTPEYLIFNHSPTAQQGASNEYHKIYFYGEIRNMILELS